MQIGLLPVTLIISVFNEEEIIEEKIKNTFQINYPEKLLHLIFITDGSTDNSNNIISKYQRIQLLHQPERNGKVAAMNRAMNFVTTPIVIFSDANGFLNRDCIHYIIRHYGDEKVGCVSGEKQILVAASENDPVARGEGLYWSYESWLKKLDSQLYSTMGAAGELMSIRTSLYTVLPDNTIIEDFVQSLKVCIKGKVIRYEPLAISAEAASAGPKEEMERKIRISAGAFQAMGMLKPLFNPLRSPLLFFQFISHRILRWTVCPLALPILFISSILLYISTPPLFFGLMFWVQVIVYALALAGWLLALNGKYVRLLNLPFYLVFMHLCVFVGFYRFLTNKQSVLWQKAVRKPTKI